MSWEEIRLEEIADFRNGVNFTNDSFGNGIKVINVADFKDRMYPDYESLGELDSEAKWHKDCFLKENDIVFVRSNGNKNLIGRSLFIKNLPTNIKVTYSAFSIRLRFKSSEDICPDFYLYLFKSPIFRSILSQYGNGANISNLNQDILNNMSIPKPPLPIQQKIASILSSYDELIENNEQRIKLLEEMAEEIYKEWFVRLRFPGYENTKIVNGLPDGWLLKSVDEISNIEKGPALNYEIPEEEGVPVINQSCVRNGVLELQKILYAEDVSKNKSNCMMQEFDILINSMGEGTLGRVSRNVNLPPNKFIIHNCITFLRSKNGYSQFLLYYLINQNQNYFTTIAQGSTGQTTLKKEMIGKLKAIYPDKLILNKFNELILPMWAEIGILINKNQLLQETRDLLLPRLISGKLSVEHLIDNEEDLLMVAEPKAKY